MREKTVRIGTRDSALAMVQAELLREAIVRHNPGLRTELVPMKTTGDIILDKTLDQVGGKGLFVRELDQALREGRVDLCVHSYKDLPTDDHPELPVVAVSAREDPRDVLILPQGCEAVDETIPVGCSSARRRIQLEALYPDWPCEPVRGNVPTRLRKLDEGQYGGLVLAAAGIRRLGLWERVCRVFTSEEMLPAACQGILAVQARRGEDVGYLQGFHDPAAWDASRAERAYIRALEGGCFSPAAAYARPVGETLELVGLYVDEAGNRHYSRETGPRRQAEELGTRLAERLRQEGGTRVWLAEALH